MEELLFVYGLLRYGFSLHRELLGLHKLVAVGFVEGFEMFDLGGYPGVIKGFDVVWGEVYTVSPEELREIDGREGGYQRVKVNVNVAPLPDMKPDLVLEAWMYVWRGSVDYSRRIPGGDYARYMNVDPVVPYFTYGRNLNVARFLDTVGLGKIYAMAPARLRGYRRLFGVKCREGSCTALVKASDSEVHGAVYYLRRSSFDPLDRREGHPHDYRRTVMPVEVLPWGRTVYAIVYDAVNKEALTDPDCRHVCDVVVGLRLHGYLEEAAKLQREHTLCECDVHAL